MADQTLLLHDYPLASIVQQWTKMIEAAQEFKDKDFGAYGKEAMQFFDGDNNWMWQTEYAAGVRGYLSENYDMDLLPTFKMQTNRVAEFAQVFLPSVYHRNPTRRVTPRKYEPLPVQAFGDPMDPMTGMMVQQMWQQAMMQDQNDQVRRDLHANLMQMVLNYSPNELDLKGESRNVLLEAIIKGMGTWWHEVYKAPGGTWIVGSFYDSVDNLLLDPDAEKWRDLQWVARRCVAPVWAVEREYGLTPGSLEGHGHYQSSYQQAQQKHNPRNDDARKGKSNDLICYYKIYSKMGFGDRGMDFRRDNPLNGMFDDLGDFCFLVVAPGVMYPLNFAPEHIAAMDDAQFKAAAAWPAPFWMDGRWPFTKVAFHDKPGEVWPISHLKPGIGELRFLNWAYSHLADKMQAACTTLVGVVKQAGEEMKDTLLKGASGFKIIELEHITGRKITDLVSFLNAPPFHGDIWTVIAAVEKNLDRRLGTSEILFGMSETQDRSATTSQVKQTNATIRIDDMRSQAEDAMTEASRAEALLCHWTLRPQDVMPILGPQRTQLWMQIVMTAPFEQTVREYDYRIEQGSTSKPNQATELQDMNEAVQVWTPVLMPFAQMGFTQPVNVMMNEWGKARNIDMTPYNLPVGPMMQPQQPPPGEEQAAAAA